MENGKNNGIFGQIKDSLKSKAEQAYRLAVPDTTPSTQLQEIANRLRTGDFPPDDPLSAILPNGHLSSGSNWRDPDGTESDTYVVTLSKGKQIIYPLTLMPEGEIIARQPFFMDPNINKQ